MADKSTCQFCGKPILRRLERRPRAAEWFHIDGPFTYVRCYTPKFLTRNAKPAAPQQGGE